MDDCVDLGNPTSLRITGSLTISAWVKADAFPNGDDNYIVTKSNSETPSIAYKFTATIDNGVEQFYISVTTDGVVTSRRYTATTITSGVWYHVVGVYNAMVQTLDIYLNGKKDNGTLGGAAVPSSIYDSSASVLIGAFPDPLRYFAGIIDDVRIYNPLCPPPRSAGCTSAMM